MQWHELIHKAEKYAIILQYHNTYEEVTQSIQYTKALSKNEITYFFYIYAYNLYNQIEKQQWQN